MWLWILDQQINLLACTGVGNVFDVFGIGLARFWKGGWVCTWGGDMLCFIIIIK